MNVIDAAVARALRMKFEPGLLKQPYVDPGGAKAANGSAEHRAREAVGDSAVVLKKDRHVLPLLKMMQSIVMIATDAEEARLGGYSGPGSKKESLLKGIRQALGSQVEICYAPAPERVVPDFRVVPACALDT